MDGGNGSSVFLADQQVVANDHNDDHTSHNEQEPGEQEHSVSMLYSHVLPFDLVRFIFSLIDGGHLNSLLLVLTCEKAVF